MAKNGYDTHNRKNASQAEKMTHKIVTIRSYYEEGN